MASIFTFDPSPPSVSSPWSTPRTSTPRLLGRASSSPGLGRSISNLDISQAENDDPNIIVTSLKAEPQDGPTEYKLHLLLRRRRSFTYMSTSDRVSGSRRLSTSTPRNSSTTIRGQQSDSPGRLHQAGSSQSRQTRLEQLTTQLLWRLQQSSSYHSSSYTPSQKALYDLLTPGDHPNPQTVFPGLEDSKGALYEIGVADDGNFVGLAEDELEESLQTLRTMATSLGCTVSVLRKVMVGNCEWFEPSNDSSSRRTRKGHLWVAEAYVRPNSGTAKTENDKRDTEDAMEPQSISVTDQLRITLAGATMSGKSSLLGTLTTATLDNGRGKSRLSLLKHQHEIATGMTSSVTHEILGYCASENSYGGSKVVNFASANVSSWIDIHASCQTCRLIFFSDSAGHPRFRRTTVRGLLGWAPHWTVLCIPSDSLEDTSGCLGSTPPSHETLGLPIVDVDLSQDHLDLCLMLELPLIVVITKVDLASRPGLRSYLNKILSILKRAGRQPLILPDYGRELAEYDMSHISAKDVVDVNRQISGLREEPRRFVPIVLTSAVKGMGIRTLHTLLHELPIPAPESAPRTDDALALFDIEDTYTGTSHGYSDVQTIILSGAMRYGRISLGDELYVGPYFTDVPSHVDRRPTAGSHLRASSPSSLSRNSQSTLQSDPSPSQEEWYKVRVCSVRHLRLPARTLVTDQVGTIAIVPVTNATSKAWRSIRKGMILASGPPRAQRSFIAEFARKDVDPLSIGSSVVVYFNSVRASAKIIAGAIAPQQLSSDANEAHKESSGASSDDENGGGFAFGFDEDEDGGVASAAEPRRGRPEEKLLVTFQFLASREYVQLGAQVLVMPGGGAGLYTVGSRGSKGVAGLAGFVGRVVDM